MTTAPSPPNSSSGGLSDGRYVITGEEIDTRFPQLLVHPLYQLLQAVLGIHPAAAPPPTAAAAAGTEGSMANSPAVMPPPPPSAIAPEIIDYCDVIRSSLSSSALHLVPLLVPPFPSF
jgi:hypothetical protein